MKAASNKTAVMSLLFFLLCAWLGAESVAHWDFENATPGGDITTVLDKTSGIGLAQSDQGGRPAISDTVSASPPGPSGNKRSADFVRDNRSFLQTASSEKLNVGEYAAFTLELWLNPRAYPATQSDSVAAMLVQKRGGNGPDPLKPGYHLALNFEGKILFRAEGREGGGKTVKSTASALLGEWTHVAVTRDADGLFSLYVNGKQDTVAGGPRFTGSLENDGAFVVGANRFAQNKQFYFDGLLDDLRLSNTDLKPGEFLFQ